MKPLNDKLLFYCDLYHELTQGSMNDDEAKRSSRSTNPMHRLGSSLKTKIMTMMVLTERGRGRSIKISLYFSLVAVNIKIMAVDQH